MKTTVIVIVKMNMQPHSEGRGEVAWAQLQSYMDADSQRSHQKIFLSPPPVAATSTGQPVITWEGALGLVAVQVGSNCWIGFPQIFLSLPLEARTGPGYAGKPKKGVPGLAIVLHGA